MTRTDDTILLIQDSTQQHIGIDKTLHQNVGLAILTEGYSPTGTLLFVITIHVDRLDKAHLHTFLNGITGTGIIGTNNGHTLLVASLLEEDNHIIQGSY